jgi:hypothetical protein
MAYTRDGVMAQIWVAFGQGTGPVRVSQNAAMELHRWYYNAITEKVLLQDWEDEGTQALERVRAIGSLSAMNAVSAGATVITAEDVFKSATMVQAKSLTLLPSGSRAAGPQGLRPSETRAGFEPHFATHRAARLLQAGGGVGRVRGL